jgi:AcrR family transcriptional regulator
MAGSLARRRDGSPTGQTHLMSVDPAQQRRREQVLGVTARLAAEGYDAVRMKQVAD